MNETLGVEWLNKAYHHLGSAKILYEVKHFTDVIGVDLHYAIKVTLKSILAYKNQKIVKTHDLIDLSLLLEDKISFTQDELRLLATVTTYHIRGSYPPKDRKLPSCKEIGIVLNFSIELFSKVCTILNINEEKVKY